MLSKLLLCTIPLLTLAPIAAAQSPKPQFTVASIRENKSQNKIDKPTSNIPLDRSNSYSPTGGTLSATNQSLIGYLIFAYKINVSEFGDGLLRKLPDWAQKDKFDIIAKTDSPHPTKDDMRLMMQSLFEDRFRLTVHREKKEVPVFAMTLIKPGKPGPQLKPHDPKSDCSVPAPAPPPSTPAASLVGIWPANCGDGAEMGISRTMIREGGRDMSMEAIANWLKGVGDAVGVVDHPISEQTGLTGTFDFVLDLLPNYPGMVKPDDTSVTPSPTYLEALEDQLGLRLKKQQGFASFFYVDHIEYPSPN